MSSKPIQAGHDAVVLPRIRALEADGLSLRQIADQLQADGVPTPRPGKQWNHIAVKRILERTAARGSAPESDSVTLTGPVTLTANGVTLTGPVTVSGATTVNGPAPEPKSASPGLIGRIDTATLLALTPPPGLSLCSSRPPRGESLYDLIQTSFFRRTV